MFLSDLSALVVKRETKKKKEYRSKNQEEPLVETLHVVQCDKTNLSLPSKLVDKCLSGET